ncbi:MAG: hypothetical protein ACR2PK_15570 [Acidimicrobiales bacterium]
MSERPSNNEPTKKFNDSEAEALLSGAGTPEGGEDVASVLHQIRATAKPPVAPGAGVGDFISERPSTPPYIDEVPLAPVADLSSRRRSFIQRPAARIAMVAGITLFGLTGAYAAGLIDVPGLPDNDEPADVVASEVQPSPTTTPASQPATQAAQDNNNEPGSSSDEEFGATLGYGAVSLSIDVQSSGDGYIVSLDVEGVSPACETAIESLSGPVSLDDLKTKSDEFEALALEIKETCGPELEALMPSLDDPESIEQFLDGFEYELDLPESFDGLEGFFGGELGALGGFLEGFDAEDFEKFMEEFGLEGGETPFEGFKLDGLDDLFGGESLKGFAFNPEDLEKFLEEFDPEDLDGMLEGFGFSPEDLDKFLGGFEFDAESLKGFQLDQFLEDFDLGDLDGMLEGFTFDPESFERFEGFFEDFNPEDLDEFFSDKDLDDDIGDA